jgi:uncharacterized protein YkwD
MRFRLPFSTLLLALWGALSGCGAGAGLAQSNSTKMGEALAFAAVAGAAQVVQGVAEQHARNNAPVTHASKVNVSPDCDNQGQYGCVSISGGAPSSAPLQPDPEMDAEEAHDYVLGYVNGVRKLNGVAPIVRDDTLDAFALAGSDELSQDHKAGQHLADHGAELGATHGELQGPPDGSSSGSLQDQLAGTLLRWMGEGPGGMHHDLLLKPEWRKLGVGIVSRGGRTYFTVDFAG